MIKMRRYKYLLTAGLVMLLFVSCNKWLDVRPKTKVKQDDLFSNAQGFSDALTGIYTRMTASSLYGRNLTFGFMDALAQRYNMDKSHSLYQASVYNYEDGGVEATINSIWGNMYNVIANINNLLAHIDGNKQLLGKTDYQLIKGEALGLRAYLHFDLLRMFSPSYLSGADKRGIPYVTAFSKKVTPVYTVKATIDSIITDLKVAEELLSIYPDIDDYTVPNYEPPENILLGYRQNHFNYWAAKAELARVYLYIGDKQNAAKYAWEVINSEEFGFVSKTQVSAAGGYKDRTFIPGQIFALSDYHLADVVPTYFKGEQNQSNGLTLSDQQRDELYEIATGGSTDYRYVYLWELDGPARYPSKFWQDEDVLDRFKNLMPLIRIPEMYYIAAECTTDPTAASGYLNTVRAHRGIQSLPDNLNSSTLQEEIFKAYRKEFYAEGQLFYYYKRLNMDHIIRSAITPSDAIYVFPWPDNEIQFGNRQ